MPVRTRTVPDEALQVGNRWNESRKGRHRQRRRDSSVLPVSYPVYYLGLRPVVVGERGAGAVFVGWRHFVQSAGKAIQLSIEAVSDRLFKVTRYRRLRDDELEWRLLQRHVSPEEHEGRSFELRALLVPPLVNLALWLRAEDGGPDLFVPVDTCVVGLRSGEIHTSDDFFLPLLEPGRHLLESFDTETNILEVAATVKRTPKPKSKRSRSQRPKRV
jgi:hypothetical protein